MLIGQINYINTWPIFQFFKTANVDPSIKLVKGVPTEMNEKMRKGEIIAAPISAIEYLQNPGQYLVVEDLSISSFGAVNSVLLISKKQPQDLNNLPLAVPKASATSVALLKILAKHKYNISLNLSAFDHPEQVLNELYGALLIGDQALRIGALKNFNMELIRTDLGQEWWEMTHTPFVFALWCVQRGFVERHPDLYQKLSAELHRAKDEGKFKMNQVIEKASKEVGLPAETIVAYYKSLSYDLGPDHLKGLKLFKKYLQELNII